MKYYKDGIISDEAAKKIIKEATKHSNEVIGVTGKLEFIRTEAIKRNMSVIVEEF